MSIQKQIILHKIQDSIKIKPWVGFLQIIHKCGNPRFISGIRTSYKDINDVNFRNLGVEQNLISVHQCVSI